MRREYREKAYGPYEHRRRWRVEIVGANRARRRRSFATYAAAAAYISIFEAETDGRTVSAAVDLYVAHLRARGLADTTIETTEYRLRGLLQTTGRDRPLRKLTKAIARQLFATRAVDVAAETQHGELAAASGACEWWVEQGWLKADPFAALAPIGRRGRKKPQLRIDEARKLLEAALGEGSSAGLAVALALLMGVRASEVTKRVVRDVDDGARVLWIERAKTKAGDRHLEVPEVLRASLAALCAGRGGGEPLFGDVDRHWIGRHARRLCKVAGVLELGPQALRGTWSSIAVEATPVDQVARALGHAGPAVTRRNYLASGAERAGQQRTALRVLAGGR